MDLTKIHNLSGPIAVEGAEPGDCLVVDILDGLFNPLFSSQALFSRILSSSRSFREYAMGFYSIFLLSCHHSELSFTRPDCRVYLSSRTVEVSSAGNSTAKRVKPFGTFMVNHLFLESVQISLILIEVSMLPLDMFLAFVLLVSLTQVL